MYEKPLKWKAFAILFSFQHFLLSRAFKHSVFFPPFLHTDKNRGKYFPGKFLFALIFPSLQTEGKESMSFSFSSPIFFTSLVFSRTKQRKESLFHHSGISFLGGSR
jgi:hypothetical protein